MSVESGQILTGKVTGITNFGAFVDLGDNQSGLVHISEVSDGFVKDIKDYLTMGQEVQVKVLKVTDDNKINLSIKQAGASPQATKQKESDSRPVEKKPMVKSVSSKVTSNKNSSTNDFDAMMNSFLRDSEDRLASLRRNTEGKRGGRGGRRK
ncbi:S1 domain-containing RNA-binding protein [Hutsoniella sourekii]|uniref:S1 domain-containing RNA-binding protein n=1 Tax=Hutsoniella sourekii TaxID=87650 RepID=UPI00047FDF4E|nr:S1 domain-containing RNA-binding protein [Hutsoniella sourekii]